MGDYSLIRNSLARFVSSIVDLSINEKTIHALHSSDVKLDKIFENFEHLIKTEHKDFCKKFIETAFKKKNLMSV